MLKSCLIILIHLVVGFADPSNHGVRFALLQPRDDANPWMDAASALIQSAVHKSLPHNYEDTRRWGMQSRFYAGFEFRRDGLRLETKRRWVTLNQGTWRRFSVAPMDSGQSLQAKVLHLKATPQGAINTEVEFTAPLSWRARQSEWQRGVQLYSISAEGTATVHLKVACDVALNWNRASNPATLELAPRVTDVVLSINDLRVHRVSKLGGEFAQLATQLANDYLREKSDELNQKLAAKLNREIEANREKLTVPLSGISETTPAQLIGWLFGDRESADVDSPPLPDVRR